MKAIRTIKTWKVETQGKAFCSLPIVRELPEVNPVPRYSLFRKNGSDRSFIRTSMNSYPLRQAWIVWDDKVLTDSRYRIRPVKL